MVEEIQEAKQLDQIMDEHLDKRESETPPESSTETKPEGAPETTETSTAEVDKTEQVKEVEDNASLSVEDKIAKIGEILGDDEKALEAYVKEKGYHNDPAWIKQREIIDRQKTELASKVKIEDDDKKALEDFKKVTSSAEYIREKMKQEGYTPEAIDKELREKGFEIPEKPTDDLQLVTKELNIDPKTLNEQQKYMLEDTTKIVDIILKDRLGKLLPEHLNPIKEHLGQVEQDKGAEKLMSTMESLVEKEGVLDFKKDIEPEIDKFIDSNPDAKQQDILAHFNKISRELTIERLKTGKRKEARTGKKGSLRQNVATGGGKTLPEKTGNFDTDADAVLDSHNIS